MFGLGVTELILIALILVLFFGARRLPAIGEGLGKTFREIRNLKRHSEDDAETEDKEGRNPNEASAIEKEVAGQILDKVSGRIPAVRQARRLKKGADKVKNLLS